MDVDLFLDTLSDRGIMVRRVGKEAKILCPFHDEVDPSLFINRESGKWHCFGCDKGGKLEFLAKRFGIRIDNKNDAYHVGGASKKGEPITNSPDGIIYNYFVNRGFDKENIYRLFNDFGIKKVRFGSQSYVYASVNDFDNNQVGWLMRSITDKKFIMKRGFESKKYFFGEHLLPKDIETLIVVEGPFDLFKVYCAGYPVLASLGLGGANQKLARVIKQCSNLKNLILFFDSDVEETDERLAKWVYYGKLFNLIVDQIKLEFGDPGLSTIIEIQNILG